MNKEFDAIIITSDEPYGQMWHTQLLYADFLSKTHKVFYIAPPQKWTTGKLFKRSPKKTKISSSLTLIHYPNMLPSRWNERNDKLLSGSILKELKAIQAKKVLIWHFDSFRAAFRETFFSENFQVKRIYHVIDPFYHNPLNDWLSRSADLLVLTSERNKRYYEAYDKKTSVVPQAIDLELHTQLVAGHTTQPLPEKFAVLLGTLSDDVDLELLYHLFSESGLQLVVIGKLNELTTQKTAWEKLLALPNVHFKGMLQPKEFYPILKKAFAGLILYTEKKQKQVSSPLKVLNYLAAGLPVISNLHCEIDALLEKGIYEVKRGQEWKEKLEKASRQELKTEQETVNQYLKQVSLQNVTQRLFSKF